LAEKRQYSVKMRRSNRTFQSWTSMKSNCYNRARKCFNTYMARGIKVCDRWSGPYSFEEFAEDMGERPPNTVLRRKDTSKDFCPENCEWAPRGGREVRSKFTPDEAARSMLYSNLRSKAKAKNMEWSITKEDFAILTKSLCYYCDGSPQHIKAGYKTDFTYNGLDRVNNSRGYSIDNVVPCCRMCNVAKNYYTQDEFLQWAGNVYLHNFKRTTDLFMKSLTAPATAASAT
jgi:hypothetical protein